MVEKDEENMGSKNKNKAKNSQDEVRNRERDRVRDSRLVFSPFFSLPLPLHVCSPHFKWPELSLRQTHILTATVTLAFGEFTMETVE